MSSKRRLTRKSSIENTDKRRKLDSNVETDTEINDRYKMVAGIPILNLGFEESNEDDNQDNMLSVAESGVLQASLVQSIKTMLYEPVIFKKYYHKIRDSHNINNNMSIKIFFLKLSHLNNDYEQPYFYFKSYLKYFKDLERAPNGNHKIKNAPKEVPHQSMNGSMHRLFDTVMKINNFHQFNTRLFILKNDELEEEYEIEQTKLKEDIFEERERQKELKLKAKQERIERQQKSKEMKNIEKEKQKELKEKLLLQKQAQKELRQKQKEEDKKKKELAKIEKKKEKLEKEKQRRDRIVELERFRRSMARIDAEKYALKEQEKQLREEHVAKFSAKDLKSEETVSEKTLEDKKMIYNLNLMGKKNDHLSKLMKTLASGKGTKEEISEFKSFMDTARKMKVDASWTAKEKEKAKQKRKEEVELIKKERKEDEQRLLEFSKQIQEKRRKLQEEKDNLQILKETFLKEQEESDQLLKQENANEDKLEKDDDSASIRDNGIKQPTVAPENKTKLSNEQAADDNKIIKAIANDNNDPNAEKDGKSESTKEKDGESKYTNNKDAQNQSSAEKDAQCQSNAEKDAQSQSSAEKDSESHSTNENGNIIQNVNVQAEIKQLKSNDSLIEIEPHKISNDSTVKSTATNEETVSKNDNAEHLHPEVKIENTFDDFPKADKKKKKLRYDEQLTTFQSKYTTSCDLVFEFLDNGNDRYVMPKDAIVAYDQKESIMKLSWITILNHNEIEKTIPKKKSTRFDYSTNLRQLFPVDILEKSDVVPIFMANTIQFEMNQKFLPLIKANLINQEEVFNTMEWIIQNGERAEMDDVMYTLRNNDKQESTLAENLREEIYRYELSRSRFKN